MSKHYKVPTRYEKKIYFRSFHWRWIQGQIRRRARGVCEGCGEKAPLEIVHLHWRTFRDERFQDLEARCKECAALLKPKSPTAPARKSRPATNWEPMAANARRSLAKAAKRFDKGGTFAEF